VVAIPAFMLLGSDNIGLIFLGLLLIAIVLNCMIGVMAATLPALFPTRIRYSALAASFNVAIIIAGLTPTAAAWIVEETDNLMMPAYYLMAAAVVGLITAVFMPETANRP
ncbi:MFS transporter, partial [Paraburkholderia sp. SIMBA_009]